MHTGAPGELCLQSSRERLSPCWPWMRRTGRDGRGVHSTADARPPILLFEGPPLRFGYASASSAAGVPYLRRTNLSRKDILGASPRDWHLASNSKTIPALPRLHRGAIGWRRTLTRSRVLRFTSRENRGSVGMDAPCFPSRHPRSAANRMTGSPTANSADGLGPRLGRAVAALPNVSSTSHAAALSTMRVDLSGKPEQFHERPVTDRLGTSTSKRGSTRNQLSGFHMPHGTPMSRIEHCLPSWYLTIVLRAPRRGLQRTKCSCP